MGDYASIAQQFTQYYYAAFDRDRHELAPLYRENSMLTFENAPSQGTASIITKLADLPFTKIQHRVDTLDAQPSTIENSILVLVTGALLVDEEQRAMNYTQSFLLLPDAGSYYVFNDIFRLVYSA